MQNYKPPVSIKIINVLTDILVGLLFFVTILLSGIWVFVIFQKDSSKFEEVQLSISVPYEVEFSEAGTLSKSGNTIPVSLTSGKVKLQFEETPRKIILDSLSSILIILVCFGYVFWNFRKFIRKVNLGKFFHALNSRYFRNMAIGLLAMWVLTIAYNIYFTFSIGRYLEFERINFENVEYDSDSSYLLLIALFLWVLSHIFAKGFELQEDSSITV